MITSNKEKESARTAMNKHSKNSKKYSVNAFPQHSKNIKMKIKDVKPQECQVRLDKAYNRHYVQNCQFIVRF